MGASNSTRRITVVNDETSGVIKISDSVVHRLRGEWDTQTSSKGSPKSGTGGSGDAPQSAAGQQAVSPRKEPSSATSPPSPTPPKSQDIFKGPQGRVEDAKRVENYWRDKLRESERRNEELHHQTVNEFNRGLIEVESLFVKPSCDPVCREHQAKVQKCYEDNLSKSLNCSKEVKAFAGCVDALRQKSIVKG